MSCYYHQDWALDAGSDNECDLWSHYFTSENLTSDEELISNVRALLEEPSDQILKTLSEFQSSGKYWNSSSTAKQWLIDFEQYLNTRPQNAAHRTST
ncbi:contact-dependent growth inhibition system immunity protein [Stutzerimonas zhaodongensis]